MPIIIKPRTPRKIDGPVRSVLKSVAGFSAFCTATGLYGLFTGFPNAGGITVFWAVLTILLAFVVKLIPQHNVLGS